MSLPQLQPPERTPFKYVAVSDHHNHAGVFTILIKSGTIVKGVKDVPF